jgi:hypothetical protein
MPSKKLTLPDQEIRNLIREIRGQRVILDSDLARVYGVPTFRFNERSSEIGIVFRPTSCSS